MRIPYYYYYYDDDDYYYHHRFSCSLAAAIAVTTTASANWCYGYCYYRQHLLPLPAIPTTHNLIRPTADGSYYLPSYVLPTIATAPDHTMRSVS